MAGFSLQQLPLLPLRCVRYSRFGNFQIFGFAFNTNKAETFEHGGFACAARTHKRIKDNSTGRGHQSAQIAHQIGRLDRLRGVRVRDTHPILLSEMLLQLRRHLVELLLRNPHQDHLLSLYELPCGSRCTELFHCGHPTTHGMPTPHQPMK